MFSRFASCQSTLCSNGWFGDVATILAGLEEIGGFINREVAKKIKMKYSPKYAFIRMNTSLKMDFIDQLDNMTFVETELKINLTTKVNRMFCVSINRWLYEP